LTSSATPSCADSTSGGSGWASSTSGAVFADGEDFCENGTGTDQSAAALPQCLAIIADTTEE